MDVFSLIGKISIEYANADTALNKISSNSDKAANSLKKVDGSSDETSKSLKNMSKNVDGASDGIDDMGDSSNDTSNDVDKLNNSINKNGESLSKWDLAIANTISNGLMKLGQKCIEIGKNIVDLGSGFTSVMSEVQALSGSSAKEMELLESTARKFGSTTVFSATESAEALKYMALAGWSAKESSDALGGVLDLAASAGMGLAEASDMCTDYMSAFGWEASRSAEFADKLAYAQANSNTSVSQLGEAFKNCAANMNAAGQDMETVTSLLEALANQGIKGAEAGTQLKAVMRDITNAMENGSIAIGNTNVSVTDAHGNFRDLTDILIDVENATKNMGDAEKAASLSTIFTSESVSGLNTIFNEGIDNIVSYEEALRNSNGAASKMAATMNDNLLGDIKNMGSAFEELGLKIFENAESPLRSVVGFITNSVVPGLEALVNNMDVIIPTVGGLTTAIVTFKTAMAISNVINLAVKSFNAYKAANEGATIAQWALNGAINANPIMLIISLIAGLVSYLIILWNTNEGFRNSVISVWDSIREKFSTVIEFIKYLMEEFKAKFDEVKSKIEDFVNSSINKFNEIKNNVLEVFNGIRTTVSGAIDFVRNTISDGISAAKGTVDTVLGSIGEKFSSIFEAAKKTVSGAIDFIKGCFNFTWSLPHINLPHFSVSGGKAPWGFGGKGSLPSISVDWYNKAMEGMIMNVPTIFGMDRNGNLMAGGESGSETVVGTDNLMAMIEHASNKGIDQVIELLARICYLLSPDSQKENIREAFNGLGYEVDGREFARLVRKYA